MGLGNGNKQGSNIISVIGGSFRLRCNENDEGAIGRELTRGPNAGKKIYEQHYRELTGRLVGGFIYEGNSEYGDNALITVRDDEEGKDYCLSMTAVSKNGMDRNLSNFIRRLPNIDPRMDVSLIICKDKEKKNSNGDPVYFMLVKQGDAVVPAKWTRDEPGDCPQAVKGKRGWDFSEQEDFLCAQFEQWFLENGEVKDGNATVNTTKDADVPDLVDDYEDDIPF